MAIAPEGEELPFSGSAVMDGSTMVAIFTVARAGRQVQSLAFSTDRGRTFERYAGNPVLDIGSADFRDPKVFAYDGGWVMAIALSAERRVRFFPRRPEVVDAAERFRVPQVPGEPWECPDLFALDGRWVLIVSVGPAVWYWVGDFDGERFVADRHALLDHGPDLYAPVTFNGTPRRVMIGWMNSWTYAHGREWRSSMSVAARAVAGGGRHARPAPRDRRAARGPAPRRDAAGHVRQRGRARHVDARRAGMVRRLVVEFPRRATRPCSWTVTSSRCSPRGPSRAASYGAMEAVILCGVQGSGKTTLYRDRFLETHARMSMDLLRTRPREAAFLLLCLETRTAFVVDNTNPTVAERARYLAPAREAGFKLIGYLVEVDHAVAAGRNRARERTVPAAGLRDVARRLVRPTPEEGFDELWHATAGLDGWRIEPLLTTPPLF